MNGPDWLGYAASALIVVSVLMRSMISFRWLNSLGSVLYTVYGVLAAVWPLVFFNAVMLLINGGYIVRHFTNRESFRLLDSSLQDSFTRFFLDFYGDDIRRLLPAFDPGRLSGSRCLLAIRNGRPVGVFVYRPGAGREMVIVVDYVIAEFRDYKTGQFIHEKLAAFVIQGQYDCLALERDIAGSMHADHRRYIGKIGYRQDGDGVWRLDRRTLAARYCRG